jgi:hypothetical protein
MLLVVALLSIQAPSVESAAPSAVPPAPAPIVVEGKKEKKVCKTIDPGTGSRIGIRRICRSADEWKMSERQAQQIIEKEQDRQRAVHAYDENAKNGLARQGPQ